MEYVEAVKKVQAKKVKENYLVIELERDTKILLPYKEGMIFLSSLSNAETLKEDWGQKPRITPIERSTIRSFIMSGEEYEQYKIAILLNISLDEVKECARKAA